MNAINNLLQFINNNWTLITAILAAAFGIYVKVKKWLALTKEQKKKAAIEAVRISILDLVTEAEQAYGGGTGVIKRSQVLHKIFDAYPVLAEALNIDATTDMLDGMIDEALRKLRELLEDNKEFYDIVYNTLTISGEELAQLADLDLSAIPEKPDKEE